jgi:hypothetical protein
MLANWSHSTIIEALEYVEADQLQVPRILLDILGKLGAQPNSASSQRHVAATMPHNRHQTAELLDRLLRDGNHESYVPDDYSDALAVLAAADVATSLDPNQVDELLDTLNGHALERQFCAILLDLLEQDIGIRSAEAIKRNLEELVPYFLETGDFVSLTRIHDHLSRKLDETPQPLVSFVNSALDIFAGENFIAQVLDGLDNWGKDQHPAIREMMGRIGLPFVTPLLDILAEEPVMARRRLYMDCLRRIGSQALESIAARLSDPRWYVVRNLVILVREINDPGALPSLSRLVGHAHPKVQYEVIRTYLHFKDPRADRHLLRELEQNDAGILVGVVKLAANSRNPEVARRLTELLNARGASDQELALKSTIINSLAEMGCVDALPGLAAFIESRSLFMARPLLRLKLEAVESLGRYASPEAVDLAARIHQKSTGDIAQAAEKICLRVRGLTP